MIMRSLDPVGVMDGFCFRTLEVQDRVHLLTDFLVESRFWLIVSVRALGLGFRVSRTRGFGVCRGLL